jgi:sarcosine oxidase subunit beta
MFRKCEVLVIGGGSTGSSIIYNLTKQGLNDVILVEKGEQIASGQTGRSTALIRTHYSSPAVAKMALLSLKFFRNFEEEMNGRSAGFKLVGLIIGGDEKSAEGIRENMIMHHVLGIESRIIDRDEVKNIEPELDPDAFSCIVYEPNSGYADPSMTSAAFAEEARQHGATVLTKTRVLALERKNSTCYTAQTTGGEIEAKKVVLATGVWSNEYLRKLGLKFPIRTVRHPVTIYQRPESYSGARPLIFDFPRRMYYKPEGSRFLYAGSIELELDTSAGEVDPDNYNQDVSFEEIERFSAALAGCIPIMGTKGAFQKGYTGVYDITPDQEPIIDELSRFGYEGLYCLIGLSGHGFKLSPEFGRIMSNLVLNQNFHDYDVSIFSSDRFEKRALIRSKYELGTVG